MLPDSRTVPARHAHHAFHLLYRSSPIHANHASCPVHAASPEVVRAKARELDAALAACSSTMLRLGAKTTPWGILKHAKRVAAAQAELAKARAEVHGIMPGLAQEAQEAVEARQKLAHR